MKTSINLLCLVAFIAIAQCKKDNYSLPPETQTGANTFGCKVNGKVWVPKGSDGYSGQNIKAYYQFIYPSPIGYVFNLTATNYERDPIETVGLGSDSLKISEGMILKLSKGIKGQSGGARFTQTGRIEDTEYTTTDSIIGEMLITKFDESNLIVSGTFWFNAIDKNGKVIHITEGRFDKKFTR